MNRGFRYRKIGVQVSNEARKSMGSITGPWGTPDNASEEEQMCPTLTACLLRIMLAIHLPKGPLIPRWWSFRTRSPKLAFSQNLGKFQVANINIEHLEK